MTYRSVTIFLLFLGISCLDALRGGNLARALFWLVVGVIFFALELLELGGADNTDTATSRNRK